MSRKCFSLKPGWLLSGQRVLINFLPISWKCFSQFLHNVEEMYFRSNQPVCRSCNRPVEVVYRNTLIPIWFGHFWLATIWTTCLNQFLDNVEEISSTMWRKCPRQYRGNVFHSKQLASRSYKRPMEVVYRNTFVPVWFGHFLYWTGMHINLHTQTNG